MKFSIEDIPDEGLNLDIEEKLILENYNAVSPVTAHLELLKNENQIIINGRLNVKLEFQCSRCLKNFDKKMDIPFYMVLNPIKELRIARHELKGDEMDTGFYTGSEINLHDILKEQILLNIHMKPLCDENCKGICPKCGKDLNTESCFCEEKDIDPRLEVLKSLLEKQKE